MKTEPRQVRIRVDTIKAIQRLAEQEHRRFSNMLNVLLLEALATRHPTPPPATGEQEQERGEE